VGEKVLITHGKDADPSLVDVELGHLCVGLKSIPEDWIVQPGILWSE